MGAYPFDCRIPVQNEPLVDANVENTTMSPPPQEDLTQHELSQPPSPVRNDRQEAPEEDNDGHDGDDADGDLHENNVGDL